MQSLEQLSPSPNWVLLSCFCVFPPPLRSAAAQLASLLLAAPPSEPQDHSQLQSHGVSPSTTGANTPAPSEESSTARHVAVVEAAPLLPPKEILTQLRMSQPSVRRRALRCALPPLTNSRPPSETWERSNSRRAVQIPCARLVCWDAGVARGLLWRRRSIDALVDSGCSGPVV